VATREDIEGARGNLRALPGTLTLRPRDGILWAHPTPNKKGLTEMRSLDELRTNSPFLVAGARLIKSSIQTQNLSLLLPNALLYSSHWRDRLSSHRYARSIIQRFILIWAPYTGGTGDKNPTANIVVRVLLILLQNKRGCFPQ
jgi:hypothetical protein